MVTNYGDPAFLMLLPWEFIVETVVLGCIPLVNQVCQSLQLATFKSKPPPPPPPPESILCVAHLRPLRKDQHLAAPPNLLVELVQHG